MRVQALAFVPGLGVSQATAAMVGNALGASNVKEAKAVVRAAVGLCTAIMTTLAIAIVLFDEALVASAFDVAAGTSLSHLSIMWMELLGYGMPITGGLHCVRGHVARCRQNLDEPMDQRGRYGSDPDSRELCARL